jgi:hypothetical protein
MRKSLIHLYATRPPSVSAPIRCTDIDLGQIMTVIQRSFMGCSRGLCKKTKICGMINGGRTHNGVD